MDRIPTMEDSLKALVSFDVPVFSILDVGVQAGTKPLMSVFPAIPHYLFEPVEAYFQGIRDAYKNFDYKLIHIALSDVDGEAWQIGMCLDGSGRVTHSQLRNHEHSITEDAQLVECISVRKAKLDSVIQTLKPPGPWLLKVDVDGHEIPILQGSAKTLRNASVVIVEAPLYELFARGKLLMEAGFCLFDVVDLSYYYGTLSQVDLVFVRQDLVQENADLRPWQTKSFTWKAWMSLDAGFFRKSD
jgi:FkbM family methyltransferase